MQARSAGTAVSSWTSLPEEAREALAKEHVTQVKHEPQNVSVDLIDWADVILTMEAHHKRTVVERFPASASKIFVINTHAGLGDDSAGIRDPYGGSQTMYEGTLTQIKRALQKILEKI